jgi:hypothetical protein
VLIGAGSGPCVVVAGGARDRSVDSPDWGGYPVDAAALRHGAGVEHETNDPDVAYANVTRRRLTPHQRAWLASSAGAGREQPCEKCVLDLVRSAQSRKRR